MSSTLKIFQGASLVTGETIAGFVIDSMDLPFDESTYVVTAPIDSIIAYAGAATTITADGQSFEVERVARPIWMTLMSKLEAYRQSLEPSEK